jgi:hypothetical protein
MKSLLSDLIIITGASSITYGVYCIYPPASYICGGLFAIAIGTIMAVNIARNND